MGAVSPEYFEELAIWLERPDSEKPRLLRAGAAVCERYRLSHTISPGNTAISVVAISRVRGVNRHLPPRLTYAGPVDKN